MQGSSTGTKAGDASHDTQGNARAAKPDARGAPHHAGRRQHDRLGKHAQQLVISGDEIEERLARGFRFVAALLDGRIIVEHTGSKPRVEADPTGSEHAVRADHVMTARANWGAYSIPSYFFPNR